MLSMRDDIINGGDLAMMDFDLSQPDAPVQCPLCPEIFTVVPNSQPLQEHLILQHRLIIAKIDEIADLRQYLMYWGKLNGAEMTQFCSAILTNSEKSLREGIPERYFLLSDHLPEDKRLRDMLREIKLKTVTRAKEQERADTSFSRKCVYCYKIISGGLHEMFNHLTNVHNFSIGKPDNIVFGAKLLDAMEEKLQKLLCVYCEKKFTDVEVLRLHMRKKGHRSLNPNNRFYDQFYLINYLQPGTPWQEVKSQRDDETESQESFNGDSIAGGVGVSRSLDAQWTDWREEEAQSATCLFCSYTTCKLPGGLLQHMSSQHDCDLLALTHNFSFYDKVKAVNYIRTMIKQLQCPACGKSPGDAEALQEHLRAAGHCKLPTPALWCSKKYLQPVMLEDGLLCHLDDCPEAELSEMSECEVYSEDVTTPAEVSEDVARELAVEVQSVSCVSVVCLFCRHTALGGPSVGCNGVRELVDHMHNMHGFDLYQMTLGKSFYEQLRLINFIRRRSMENRCYYCGEHFTDPRLLEEHRTVEGHTGPPDPALYKQHEFMSPVVKDDPLLMGLDQPTWNSDSELEDDSVPCLSNVGDAGSPSSGRKSSRFNKASKKKHNVKDSRKSPIMLPDVAAQNLVKEMNDGLQSALGSSKTNTGIQNVITYKSDASGISHVRNNYATQKFCPATHVPFETGDSSESASPYSNYSDSNGDSCSQHFNGIDPALQDSTSEHVLRDTTSNGSLRVVRNDLNCSSLFQNGTNRARKDIPLRLSNDPTENVQRVPKNSDQFLNCKNSLEENSTDASAACLANGGVPAVVNSSISLENVPCLNSQESQITNAINCLSITTPARRDVPLELDTRKEGTQFYVPPLARLQCVNTTRNNTFVSSSVSKSSSKRTFLPQKSVTGAHQSQDSLTQHVIMTNKINKTVPFQCPSRQYNHAVPPAQQYPVPKTAVLNGTKGTMPTRNLNESWRRPTTSKVEN